MTHSAFIIDAIRIPRASVRKNTSAYSELTPVDLLFPLFKALETRHDLDPEQVEDVILGCNTQTHAQGANLAKVAALFAGWSDSVPGATINRFCCSGLDAINLSASKLMSGMESLLVAGGIEQLSAVPMFSDKGLWFSDKNVMAKTRFMHMGLSADLIATQQGFSRAKLDELAYQSHQRALNAQQQGYFSRSVVPVSIQGKTILEKDDAVRDNVSMDALSALPASFSDAVPLAQPLVDLVYQTPLHAQHSAGNSPAIVDGASLVLMASEQACARLGLQPRARIRHFANASDEPVKMLTGHIKATEKLLNATGLSAGQIDLWEVNESFAASVLHYQQCFDIEDDRLNVNGGAIAMGHPLGATGGNLVSMLLDEMERQDLKRGIVAICAGAGIGVATLIER